MRLIVLRIENNFDQTSVDCKFQNRRLRFQAYNAFRSMSPGSETLNSTKFPTFPRCKPTSSQGRSVVRSPKRLKSHKRSQNTNMRRKKKRDQPCNFPHYNGIEYAAELKHQICASSISFLSAFEINKKKYTFRYCLYYQQGSGDYSKCSEQTIILN